MQMPLYNLRSASLKIMRDSESKPRNQNNTRVCLTSERNSSLKEILQVIKGKSQKWKTSVRQKALQEY